MNGPTHLYSATSVGDLPLWAFIVTTVIALLAATPGIVAAKRALGRNVKIVATFGSGQDGCYRMSESGGRFQLVSTSADWPAPSAFVPDAKSRVGLDVDVRNQGDAAITIDAVSICFSALDATRPPEPPAYIVVFADAADPTGLEITAKRLGLTLDKVTRRRARYVAVQPERDREMVLAALSAQPGVADVFLDATGHADSQWLSTETVDVNLAPSKRNYAYRVAQTIEPHGALTIPLALGATEPLRGTATVTLVYQGKRHLPVGDVDVELDLPTYIRTVVRKGANGI